MSGATRPDFATTTRASGRAIREYLTYFLGVAQSFTADAAARGHGIVYSIG